jgi:hypothetical protein
MELLVLIVRIREAELPRPVLAACARRARPARALALRHAVRVALPERAVKRKRAQERVPRVSYIALLRRRRG